MSKEYSDYELGISPAAQKALLDLAYASGDDRAVEQALLRIVEARRMKRTGILEWFKPRSDEEDRH